MSGFHQQLMQQELDGAKEAAASYEKQVKRLLAENATLRDGTGLAGELRTARDQLTAALDAKQKMAAELGERLRRDGLCCLPRPLGMPQPIARVLSRGRPSPPSRRVSSWQRTFANPR